MPKKPGAVAILAALVMAAGLLVSSESDVSYRARLQPKYRFVPTTTVEDGIRAFFRTTNRFFKVEDDGSLTLLWIKESNDKPIQHWITPEGRVWIYALANAGFTKRAVFYVRDRDGEIETMLSAAIAIGDDSYINDPRRELPIVQAELVQPRNDDRVETLKVRHAGKTRNLGILRLDDGRVAALAVPSIGARVPNTKAWDSALSDPRSEPPAPYRRLHELGSEAAYWLWRSDRSASGYVAYHFGPEADSRDDVRIGDFVPVSDVEGTFFGLPHVGFAHFSPRTGEVVLFTLPEREPLRFDLVELGGYTDVEDMSGHIQFVSFQKSCGEFWVAPETETYRSTELPSKLRVRDWKGRWFVWTITRNSDNKTVVAFELSNDRPLPAYVRK